ncbi:hypothetical protein [Ligilactobacillus faecis]|uniref:hypothetical protein n=1 Tax=Ligilactobacillus faecis TaxID=762833 RepID=UPI00246933B2|nr:hypothetical protein [Ligilactobacillus faecis]WGN89582.1 hypothetical protein QFX10_00285 [Ligilactobacillus faecis]
MEWNKLQTMHFTKDMRNKLAEIDKYLENQDYFNDDILNRSKVMSIVANTFYELFVENNSRTSYQKRLNELKRITSQDEKQILQELQTIKQLQNMSFYVALSNYQNLKELNPEYTPEELRSYLTGDSNEINILLNRILAIQKQDIAHNKQIKDIRRKAK